MSDASIDGGPEESAAPSPPRYSAIYFDGRSSRRRTVVLVFADQLEIHEAGSEPVAWAYADVRRADSPSGTLRLTCLTAPPLARLEIRKAVTAAELTARCSQLDANAHTARGILTIVGWSLAATVSIVLVVLFGVPFAADRLAPLVPQSFERQVGDVADKQIKALFREKPCANPPGQLAFAKLVNTLREAAGLDTSVQSAVLPTPVPNAFALPGGRIYLFNGLLARAQNADEIAGVLAHELGHLKHRDNIRTLIYNGGSSFLIGLLFGDITGSSALIFASRTLVTASYSREAEQNADTFSIETMRKLGRSPKPMGELLFRITGKEGDKGLTFVSNHPLTEDRLARMSRDEQPVTRPPLLTADEWTALKSICSAPAKT
jgi:Zn-dependent protease with chaperone function